MSLPDTDTDTPAPPAVRVHLLDDIFYSFSKDGTGRLAMFR